MKQIILSPEIISAIASLITALIGLLIRKIEKTPLDNRIKELEQTNSDSTKTENDETNN
jgi:hypothetical protein